MINNKLQTNKGYTLLFAVLVSTLVLSVGLSILNINKKEYLLASAARESVTAFYAADGALECAAFHDLGLSPFLQANYASKVSCVANAPYAPDPVKVGVPFSDDGAGTTVARFDLNLNDSSCATVIVTKSPTGTSIESRGYNIGWDSVARKCNLPSPKRVERVLYYTY